MPSVSIPGNILLNGIDVRRLTHHGFNISIPREVNLIEIIAIAVGLSMDAFAVSIGIGCTVKSNHGYHAVMAALFFGGFQALMPVIGWGAGSIITGAIQSYAHIVAFMLLAAVGGKMIFDKPDKKECSDDDIKVPLTEMLVLAIATSIDALAAGLSFACLNISILKPVLIIGVITGIFSVAGVYGGSYAGHIFEDKLEKVGGIILILISLKILLFQ